jgi:hypothetical protein
MLNLSNKTLQKEWFFQTLFAKDHDLLQKADFFIPSGVL